MIERIIAQEFHRNGITAECFGAFTIELDEGVILLATMSGRNANTCRAVNPLDLTLKYRGDVIGESLVAMLPEEE